jgi:hypothetical protein
MELVDLAHEPHAERKRWRNGDEWDPAAVKVAVGELDGGRWYVRCYGGGRGGARAYDGPHAEWYALGTARRWMRTFGGEWVQA